MIHLLSTSFGAFIILRLLLHVLRKTSFKKEKNCL